MDTRGRLNKGNSYSAEQVKRVLVGSGLDVQSEVDTDYIIFCPFHGNHRTPAAEVDKLKGTFFCFSCHHIVDLVELVMHQTGRTYFESVRFIKSKEIETNLFQEINNSLVDKPDFVEFDKDTVIRLHETAMASDRAIQYFASRMITKESMERFKLGYSDSRDMVTVPVHAPDGMLIGFVGRSVEGKEFKNSTRLPKSKTLFNVHRIKSSRRVYVVESSFDAIRLDQVGFPAVATLGASINNTQMDLLQKYFNDIMVIADNDEAGRNMVNRMKEKMGAKVSVVQLNSQYKDIGDMDDDAIRELETSFDKSILSMLA
jgi:DNA primase